MSDSPLVVWVRQAQAGDQKAKEHLYLFVREKMMPDLVMRAPDESWAEDAVHDAFVAFLSDPDALHEAEKFLQYEARIAWRRIEHELGSGLETGHPLQAAETGYWDPSEQNLEVEEWYLAVLHELMPMDRELFRLLYSYGVSTAEGSDLLQISPGSFRLRKHRLAAEVRDLILRFRT